jgi:hypothetical protein
VIAFWFFIAGVVLGAVIGHSRALEADHDQ